MYKCKQSIILEDNYGVDHQFLKGHLYWLEDSMETHLYARGANYITPIKKVGYFISQDKIDKYFVWKNEAYAYGGCGRNRMLSFERI